MEESPRKILGRKLIEIIERTGLDPLTVITAMFVILSGYYFYRWQKMEIPEGEKNWNKAFWILSIVVVLAWIASRLR